MSDLNCPFLPSPGRLGHVTEIEAEIREVLLESRVKVDG